MDVHCDRRYTHDSLGRLNHVRSVTLLRLRRLIPRTSKTLGSRRTLCDTTVLLDWSESSQASWRGPTYDTIASRDGGTGRRSGLKIRRPSGLGGSTPPPGPTTCTLAAHLPRSSTASRMIRSSLDVSCSADWIAASPRFLALTSRCRWALWCYRCPGSPVARRSLVDPRPSPPECVKRTHPCFAHSIGIRWRGLLFVVQKELCVLRRLNGREVQWCLTVVETIR